MQILTHVINLTSRPPFFFTWQPVAKPEEETTQAQEPTKQVKNEAETEESTKQVHIDASSQTDKVAKLKAKLAYKDKDP